MLAQTWDIHNNINLYILNNLSAEACTAVSPLKGKSVGAQWAHMHNVRLMWLKVAAPELMEGLTKIEPKTDLTPQLLINAIEASGQAMSTMLQRSEADGKVKGFKPHATAFLGYIISHESHHRGQLIATLKQAGMPLDKKVLYGMWEWGTR